MSASSKLIGTLAMLVAAAACGRNRTASKNDDFSRDLQLASSTVDLAAPRVDPANLSTLETQPSSAPQRTTVLKKASSGNKIVHSRTPIMKAAPSQEVASADGSQQTQTNVPAPVAERTTEPVAQAPQPTTIPTDQQGGSSDGEYGTSGNGGGILGGGHGGAGNTDGGWGGVVIRGGGVGDGDNCDPGPVYGGVYGGRRASRPPVYNPNPSGMGTNRIPVPRGGGGLPAGTSRGRTITRRRPIG